jgi:hypothetical protein
MRTEKQNISQEYVARLNASPFFIVVDYTGLKVGPITELQDDARALTDDVAGRVVLHLEFLRLELRPPKAEHESARGGGVGARAAVAA